MKKNISTISLVICAGIIMAATAILVPVALIAYGIFFLPMLK